MAQEAVGSRPNIVFMLADDMGWSQVWFNNDGSGDLKHVKWGQILFL